MRTEKTAAMKLLLAGIAAGAGGEEAALYLLKTAEETDFSAAANLHYALWLMFDNYMDRPPDWQKREPPDWLVELCQTILADNRLATGLKGWTEGTSFTVSSKFCDTGNFEFALCKLHCTTALPLLIKRLKKEPTNSCTAAQLGAMGDRRAIPFLAEMLERTSKGVKYLPGDERWEMFSTSAYALAELKAAEAVPLLLRTSSTPTSSAI